jgi:hypothetical protein
MRVPTYQARSRPVALLWVAGALVLGAITLGLVHHASLQRVRDRVDAQPLRPLAVIDLARNRDARRAKDPANDSEPWHAAAAALGREVEIFSGDSLAEIPARRFAAWIFSGQEKLDPADFAALDSYLQLGGGAVLIGRSGRDADGRGVLAKLFPGRRFSELGPAATHLRVTEQSPLVAGLSASEELGVADPGRSLASSSGDSLAWSGDAGSAALHVLYRGAPVAWLGVSPDRIAESSQARVLAENALRYALRQPVLDLRAWPDGRPCAVLVDGPSGSGPAPSCQVDAATSESEALRELAHSGCRYAAVTPDGRALPQLLDVDGTPLVAIPEGRAQATARGSALMRELLSGYERAERVGGVYSLRADASWRAAAGRDVLFARVRDELRARGAWFAAPDDLAAWWTARSHVRADLSVLARDRIRVTFANSGSATASGVTARVYLPGGADTARIEVAPTLRASPLLRISADHTWIEVVERSLDPGSEVSYTIRF